MTVIVSEIKEALPPIHDGKTAQAWAAILEFSTETACMGKWYSITGTDRMTPDERRRFVTSLNARKRRDRMVRKRLSIVEDQGIVKFAWFACYGGRFLIAPPKRRPPIGFGFHKQVSGDGKKTEPLWLTKWKAKQEMAREKARNEALEGNPQPADQQGQEQDPQEDPKADPQA